MRAQRGIRRIGRRVFRRIGVWAARVVLALVVLVALLVSTVLVGIRTEWGRRKLLTELDPIIQKLFPGGVGIGGIGGSLLGDLELHDVIIRDLDGYPAIQIDTLS